MKKGQKIVCVNGDFCPAAARFFDKVPVIGEIYVVREVRSFNAEGGILLNEIINSAVYVPHYGGYLEPAFSQERFRLLGEEKWEEDRVEIDIKKRHLIQSN